MWDIYDLLCAFMFVTFLAVFSLSGFGFGFINGSDEIKQQAYERGYMVECLGKGGYYWECED